MALFDFFNNIMQTTAPSTKSKNLGKMFLNDSWLIQELRKEIVDLDRQFKKDILKVLDKWAKRQGMDFKSEGYTKEIVYSALRHVAKYKAIQGLFIGLQE